MQVQLALEDESLSAAARKKLHAQEKALLKKHEKEWVGDWADHFDAPTYPEGNGQVNHTGGRKYEFKRGILTTVQFGRLTVAAARAFVTAPQTRLVHELFIGDSSYDEDFEPGPDIPEDAERAYAALHAIIRWPYLQNIRRFQFGWVADEVYEDFCGFQCHLGGDAVESFVKRMPHIEELLVFAHTRDLDKLVSLKMPQLRMLQLYHGWSFPLEKLAKNPSLTKLTHVFCHPHSLEYGDAPYIRLAHLKAICKSPHLTSLTHLRLRCTDFGDKGAQEIVDSGILKRLKMLDLRHGCMTNKGAALLAGCPDLRNLEHLDLSRNALTKTGIDALKATMVPVELARQHKFTSAQDDEDGDLQYLGAGDYE